MPHYYKHEWEGFDIIAEPSGIRKFLKFLPYLTGSKPTFRVIIRAATEEQRPLKKYLFWREPHRRLPFLSSLSWSDKKSIDEQIELSPISISGDHIVEIELSSSPAVKILLNLVSFRAIAQETMIGWIIGILIGISAIVVGILNLVYGL